jgi:hypothetical protein
MEKRAVIKAGVTPPDEPVSKSQEKQAQIQQLDSDFRKRAADASKHASK